MSEHGRCRSECPAKVTGEVALVGEACLECKQRDRALGPEERLRHPVEPHLTEVLADAPAEPGAELPRQPGGRDRLAGGELGDSERPGELGVQPLADALEVLLAGSGT